MPASEIAHVCEKQRTQACGMPWGAAVIRSLRDLDDYEAAEIVRKKTEACVTAIVFGDEEAQQGIAPAVVDADGNRVEQFEPGLIAYARGGRITPGEWERRRGLRLRFVYRRRGPSLLVAEGRLNSRGLGVASRSKIGRGRTAVPIFLLVPQVKLPKRLDLTRDADRALDGLPGLIVANWVEGSLK